MSTAQKIGDYFWMVLAKYSIRYEYKRTKLRHHYEINFLIANIIGLKAVLLPNENQLPSVPVAYATDMKESYQTMEKILRFD